MNSDIAHIFRSYDIRGIYRQDLDEEIMQKIGHAFGSFIKKDASFAYDARVHSPDLKDAFLKGFLLSGKSIEDCGLLSIGSGMFHAWQSKKEFAFITASHLPKEWNGVKFFHSSGAGFVEEENRKVKDIFFSGPAPKKNGHSTSAISAAIINKYIKFLNSKIKIGKKLDIVLDCGNGCACLLAPKLYKEAGCNVKVLFGDIDGNFPNRAPDPLESELGLLKKSVPGHDIGIAYDGDADRTALVDDKGKFMLPEETSFIILSELLKKERGPVVANVECTRSIDAIAQKFGRKVIRVPVGHTFLVDAALKNKASFGVEVAGHYTIPYIIPFDDAMIIGFYVSSVLAKRGEKLSELRKAIPKSYSERLSYSCPDNVKFDVIKNIAGRLKRDFKHVNTMDGIRIDLDNGWMLLRVSNTAPVIRLTVEGESEKDKKSLHKTFLKYLEDEMSSRGLKLAIEKK